MSARRSLHVSLTRAGAAILFVATLLALPIVASSSDEEQVASDAYLTAKGRVTYRVYCANCHGPKGMGDGALAEILKIPPSDLTGMTKANGGKFPRAEVHAMIDGREEVKAHGSREMPIWGEAFKKTLQPTWKDVSDEERAQQKIVEVVYYLESIQVVD